VPFIDVAESPLAPGVSPVRLFYRDAGAGAPIVILHGGWGYEIYPFDRQIAALARTHRTVAPDRTGYGRSGSIAEQPVDFHQRAADETFALLDALGIERPILWGHSDGAVIALKMALARPHRVHALIVEATHLFGVKPRSRAFFEQMRDDPDGLGGRVVPVLEREHGPRWRDLIRTNGVAWLRLADEARRSGSDLYAGRLDGLRSPTLVVHGAKDPRTEPGELEALQAALQRAGESHGVHIECALLADGGHSPHSGRATAEEVTRAVRSFLDRLD
jgi:pimeloyl-ACP methyl ester carboxylesterase